MGREPANDDPVELLVIDIVYPDQAGVVHPAYARCQMARQEQFSPVDGYLVIVAGLAAQAFGVREAVAKAKIEERGIEVVVAGSVAAVCPA